MNKEEQISSLKYECLLKKTENNLHDKKMSPSTRNSTQLIPVVNQLGQG